MAPPQFISQCKERILSSKTTAWAQPMPLQWSPSVSTSLEAAAGEVVDWGDTGLAAKTLPSLLEAWNLGAPLSPSTTEFAARSIWTGKSLPVPGGGNGRC